jgi:hypothetical protein
MSNTNYNQTLPGWPPVESSTALPPEVSETRRRGKYLAAIVLGAALTVGPIAPFTDPYARKREGVTAESSTRAAEVDPGLFQEVKRLFERGASEFFHDGIESDFSKRLLALLGSRGPEALAAIAEYLSDDQGSPEVVSEALRRIADFGGPDTISKRWSILRQGLGSRSPVIRDGAILGFASLDDPRAQAMLLGALEKEQIRELRELFLRVVARLSRQR